MKDITQKKVFGWQGMALFIALIAILMWIITTLNPDMGNSAGRNFGGGRQFTSYWRQGKAEISRYKLDQARYGAMHPGEAVKIFVTEDFLSDKQVKYEAGDDVTAVPILKLNAIRSFTTGVYPYSAMTSVFTPVDTGSWPHSLKVTATIQEWCGHTYSQLNNRDGAYHVMMHSYFQAEGDRTGKIDVVLLEDEIWTRLRLSPALLPEGEVRVLPSLHYLRFAHEETVSRNAVASTEPFRDASLSSKPLARFILEYPDLQRTLAIVYTEEFPYEILMWEESYPCGEGIMTSRAVRTHTTMLDYWNRNSPADSTYRRALGL